MFLLQFLLCLFGFSARLSVPFHQPYTFAPLPFAASSVFLSCLHLSFNIYFFLTVYPPRIIQHPENQSVNIGVNIEFNIEATGDNLHFQWQKDGSDLSDGDKYRGVNTDTLHIVAAEGSDEGDYRCLVENDVGKLFSNEAVLSFGKLYSNCYMCM